MAGRVFAIVLAAGSATRFGSTKQLADVGGMAMVTRAVEAANDACGANTVLVAGHDAARVSSACAGLAGFVVVNDSYRDGIGASIAAGVANLRHVASAVLITLADQPLVSGAHLRALIETWDGRADSIVATAFSGTNGPPALFGSACFDDLEQLHADNGARKLLMDPQFNVATIDFEPASLDVDTPEDLRQI